MSITESDRFDEKAYEIVRSTYAGGEHGSPTRGTVSAIAAALRSEHERAQKVVEAAKGVLDGNDWLDELDTAVREWEG